MRAVVFDRYGPPDVLRLAEVERPVPEDGQVLVRVRATSTTRTDCGLRGAEYFVARLVTGLFRPRSGRVGIEFAGEVAAVGSAVTEFALGDRVFGIGDGTNAEYVCVGESEVVAEVPGDMAYEDAAVVADGALSAFSLLRSAGLAQGQRVLVYGASGSIGVGGVQVAKHLGAHVTAVCSTTNVDLVRSLGADEVIDYLEQDFRNNGQTYDVLLDAVGKLSYLGCRGSVRPSGRYITTDPGRFWHDALVALTTKKAKLGIVRYKKADLLALVMLLEAGRYRAVIDRTYRLEDVVDAHRYVETHQKTGNVVLTVA